MKKLLFILLTMVTLAAVPLSATPARDSLDRVESTTVAGVSGGIELRNNTAEAQRIFIYTITGQMLRSLTIEPGQTLSVDLPAGYYIIKTPDHSRRVLVR